MTWHIHQLIDPSTGEVVYYQPALRNEIHEIALAIKADREANLRRALAELRPQRPVVVIESQAGQSLATELWPGIKEGEG